MLSGASPWGTCQAMSPVFMSMAVMRPHGGLIMGNPSMLVDASRKPTPSGRPRMKSMSDRSGSLTRPRTPTWVLV